MSLEGVEWTWACQEDGCEYSTRTEPYAGAPECPRHGRDPVGRACEICHAEISGKRADATTCGGPCRAEKSRSGGPRPVNPQAHTGARAIRAAAPRKRPARENGARLYLLPAELKATRADAATPAGKNAAAKLRAARQRLAARERRE